MHGRDEGTERPYLSQESEVDVSELPEGQNAEAKQKIDGAGRGNPAR
jgi:hypothetical protein